MISSFYKGSPANLGSRYFSFRKTGKRTWGLYAMELVIHSPRYVVEAISASVSTHAAHVVCCCVIDWFWDLIFVLNVISWRDTSFLSPSLYLVIRKQSWCKWPPCELVNPSIKISLCTQSRSCELSIPLPWTLSPSPMALWLDWGYLSEKKKGFFLCFWYGRTDKECLLHVRQW